MKKTGRIFALLLAVMMLIGMIPASAFAAGSYDKTVQIKSNYEDNTDRLTVKIHGIQSEENVNLNGEMVHVYHLNGPKTHRIIYRDPDMGLQEYEQYVLDSSYEFVSTTNNADMHIHDNIDWDNINADDFSDFFEGYVPYDGGYASKYISNRGFMQWPVTYSNSEELEEHKWINKDVILAHTIIYGKYTLYFTYDIEPSYEKDLTVRVSVDSSTAYDNGYMAKMVISNNTANDVNGYYAMLFYSDNQMKGYDDLSVYMIPFRANLKKGASMNLDFNAISSDVSDMSKMHRKLITFSSKAECDAILKNMIDTYGGTYVVPSSTDRFKFLKDTFGITVKRL